MIGQMNKNDEIAGLRALEHLVDTVLVLEGKEPMVYAAFPQRKIVLAIREKLAFLP